MAAFLVALRAGAFLAALRAGAFLAVVFLAGAFLAAAFLVVAFLVAFLAAGAAFFAAGLMVGVLPFVLYFFLVDLVDLALAFLAGVAFFAGAAFLVPPLVLSADLNADPAAKRTPFDAAIFTGAPV